MARVKKHEKIPDYIIQIGKLMDANGDTQSDLANKLGVSRDRVNNWLQDTSPLDADNIVKIANVYGVSTDYVLGVPEKSTGFSQETVDNVRRYRAFIADFYRRSSNFSSIPEDMFTDRFFGILDRALACASMAPFLVSLANVGVACSKGTAEMERQNQAAGFNALADLQYALYLVGKNGQAIAEEIYSADKVENALKDFTRL